MQLHSYTVMVVTKYATISVPVEVKKVLEKAKGDMEWGVFILRLYTEVQRLRGMRAFEELIKTLSEDDLKAIAESSREFRERFTFR
ncbi:MAG: antitoxin VapB family protein [Candidatus Nezhaarchaeales archaeon]